MVLSKVIWFIVTLASITADKVYIPGYNNFIGISNRWVAFPGGGTGLPWNYNDPSNGLPSWEVCFSTNSILLTDAHSLLPELNSVFVEISLTGRLCSKVAKKPPVCSEKFALGAYVSNKSSTKKDNINRDYVDFPAGKQTKDFFHVEEIFEITNLNDHTVIQYMLNSKNSCGFVDNVTVFYYNCPAVHSLAKFKVEKAPSKNMGVLKIYGKCVDNSINTDGGDPYIDCYWNGTGNVFGSCICQKGYASAGTKCEECGQREFKPDDGNTKCIKCGEHSHSGTERTSCACDKEFYHEIGENMSTSPCYAIPKSPFITNRTTTSTEAYITWTHNPTYKGKYIISCLNCVKSRDAGGIFPQKTSLTSITIKGLGSYANYKLQILFENNITKLVGRSNNVEFFVYTKPGKPGTVENLQQIINPDGSVLLLWDPPFAKGGDKPEYIITYGSSTAKTSDTTFKIESDTKTRSYRVQIVVQVEVNGKIIKGPAFIFGEKVEIKGGVSLDLAVGAGIGAVIFVVVIAIAVFCIWRRRNPPYLQVVRMEDGTVKLPGRFYPGAKLYVDPTTYNDVDDAVQDFAFEIDQKSLTIGKLLGGGEFADVYKGTLFKNGKSKDVAIKTLKPGASKHDRDDFLSEAAIIGQFSDPNVIGLEGVVLKERPNVIVLEFMSNGALDKFLQNHDMQFTNLQLLGMARGVASGMKYLSELGFIHRDLAARNILVDEFRVCKVCDFGMSREIKVDETYDTQGGKIPVRWTAPEAIQFKKFTTASDIWSYGILLWEIMSYGERPYWDWGNYEVLERLNQGYRLPPPMNCPKVIHDLMLNCWNKDRTKRPKMVEIRDQLEKWIRSPDLLETTASVVTKTDENLDYTVLQTINKWLDAIGMGRYTDNFLEQGFATPRQILQLTLEDLDGLGIGPIGHRKKIYKAIQNTKAQVDQRHNSTIGGRKKTFSVSGKKGASTA